METRRSSFYTVDDVSIKWQGIRKTRSNSETSTLMWPFSLFTEMGIKKEVSSDRQFVQLLIRRGGVLTILPLFSMPLSFFSLTYIFSLRRLGEKVRSVIISEMKWRSYIVKQGEKSFSEDFSKMVNLSLAIFVCFYLYLSLKMVIYPFIKRNALLWMYV